MINNIQNSFSGSNHSSGRGNVQNFNSALDAAKGIGAGGQVNNGDIQKNADGSVSILNGMINISGPEAEKIAQEILTMYQSNPQFKQLIDSNGGEAVNIKTGYGGENSNSTLNNGASGQAEEIYINLDQVKDQGIGGASGLGYLVTHELGHALGEQRDGAIGSVGDNQRFVASILGSSAQAYGNYGS